MLLWLIDLRYLNFSTYITSTSCSKPVSLSFTQVLSRTLIHRYRPSFTCFLMLSTNIIDQRLLPDLNCQPTHHHKNENKIKSILIESFQYFGFSLALNPVGCSIVQQQQQFQLYVFYPAFSQSNCSYHQQRTSGTNYIFI